MAKENNPFDFTTYFSNFDPNKLMQDLSASMGDFKIPGFSFDVLLDTQRKNLEALTKANQLALQGTQAIAERQREILQQAMQEATSVIKDLSVAGNPQEAAQKQAAVMQQAFEKAFETMRELAEMTTKTNQEAFEALSQRFKESMAELHQSAGKPKK